jgi:hypothetical protein
MEKTGKEMGRTRMCMACGGQKGGCASKGERWVSIGTGIKELWGELYQELV